MNVARRIRNSVMWVRARMAGRYYFEDFHRVYPDGVRFDRHGKQRPAVPNDIPNYLNHVKFYRFAAQFVGGKQVADIGCGSGYGCEILSKSGAARVRGADISEKAIEYARLRFGQIADFTVQGITDLATYADQSFDVTICSEVLEHIKEYDMERRAMQELVRITKPGGLLVMVTPNSELMPDHGFSFDEIRELCAGQSDRFCIFENALVPFGDGRRSWEKRRASGNTGIIVTENIVVSETALPAGAIPEFKRGVSPARMNLGSYEFDTSLLHNTHSWVALAVRDRS